MGYRHHNLKAIFHKILAFHASKHTMTHSGTSYPFQHEPFEGMAPVFGTTTIHFSFGFLRMQIKPIFYLLSSACLMLMGQGVLAAPPHTFTQAKNVAQTLFQDHRQTLYCQCRYSAYKEIDLASCHMQSATSKKRAHRLEWEHMMPAEHFGHHFSCWREPICKDRHGKPYKGRKCCEKIDKQFRQAESELYNLWPANGAVNQARSNYRYAELTNHQQNFYGCQVFLDVKHRQFEPTPASRGIAARASLFMSEHYHIRLSPAQRSLFQVWDKQYPPDAFEKNWAKKVKAIEGYGNPYIEAYD